MVYPIAFIDIASIAVAVVGGTIVLLSLLILICRKNNVIITKQIVHCNQLNYNLLLGQSSDIRWHQQRQIWQ